MPQPSQLHFTEGGIWHGVRDAHSRAWMDELASLLAGGNPCAEAMIAEDGSDVLLAVKYGKEKDDGKGKAGNG